MNTNALSWLEAEVAEAPESLRQRMTHSLETRSSAGIPVALADAALACLEAASADPCGTNAAIDLLAADALLTHACAAAAQAGPDALSDFVSGLDASRFQQLLDTND